MGKGTENDSIVQQIFVDYIAPEQPSITHQVGILLSVSLLTMFTAWLCKKLYKKIVKNYSFKIERKGK